MPIRALVFDFDGLILDTEEPSYSSWLEIYREHGHELPLDRWGEIIGGGSAIFDPVGELEGRVGRTLEREALQERRRRRNLEMIAAQKLLPGVEAYVAAAREHALKLAVASNSPREWVTGHLERLGFDTHWDCVVGRGQAERGKPHPDLYLAALACLGVGAEEAIAFEDSRNGVLAARAAGIYCVAVPNRMTAALDLTPANLRLTSLEEITLPDLLRAVEER